MEINHGKDARIALGKAREIYNEYTNSSIKEFNNNSIEKLIQYQTKFFDSGKKAGFEEGILQRMYKAGVIYQAK